jgi:formylglycine-generating enzyme required for sulfatase activity
MGKGSVNAQAVKLGVTSTLPYNIDVEGIAIEMVYIPAPTTRPFFGDGDGVNESVNAFHYTDNTATTSSVLPTKVDPNAYDDAELDADGIYVYSNDTLQTTNPLGTLDPFPTMKALWCMKYEISQAAYRDFLNTLSLAQQTTRTANAPTSVQGTSALVASGSFFRNYLEIKSPSVSGAPAVYGCDANGNNIYDEAGDGEWIACNFLLWSDVAAYLDWSGLGPLSELQYERICRGHSSAGANAAVYDEFAWGTSTIYSSPYTLTNPNTTSEVISNSTGGNGNATWGNTTSAFPNNGPLRNGLFATASSTRISSGAAFFGVMEMTGNVSEYCITLGTIAGRSVRFVPNGNGNISANGNAQLSVGGAGFWPGMEGNNSYSSVNTCSGTCEVTGAGGIMLRGGSWNSFTQNTFSVSARSSAVPSSVSRFATMGGRGVLYIR